MRVGRRDGVSLVGMRVGGGMSVGGGHESYVTGCMLVLHGCAYALEAP